MSATQTPAGSRLLVGHPRRRAALLALVLSEPISLLYVAAWRLDPDDGLAMVGLGLMTAYLLAYLPVTVLLAFRVCGLTGGLGAGLGVTASYPAGVLAWTLTSPGAVLPPLVWVLVPAVVVVAAARSARTVPRPTSPWPRLALALVGAPVTALALFLAIAYSLPTEVQ